MSRNLFVRKITLILFIFLHYYFVLLNQDPLNFETRITIKTDGWKHHKENKKKGQKMHSLQEPKKAKS
jgi:hypothetical protein